MEDTCKDKNLLPDGENDTDFKFPAYIKQMGNVDKRLKIYMEDYVHTYLYQYAHTEGGCEKLAVLLGRYEERDGVPVLIISGAVKAEGTETDDENPAQFNDEAWLYINEQACKYFNGLSVLGWVHIQPEMGIFMSRKDESFHKKCFKNSSQVLLLIDQTESLDCFYIYDEDKENLVPSKGYFIYYDKNENMQDYMIDNCISKPKEIKEKKTDKEIDNKTDDKNSKPNFDRIDAAKRIRSLLNKKEATKQRLKNGKYATIAFVSAVVCAAFAFMGTNLVRNMDKINILESELGQMKVSYNQMSKKVENTANEVIATKAVFSQKNGEDKEDNTENKSENKNEDEKKPLGEYTLQYGDTLWDLCHRFYGSENKLPDILAANNLSENDILYVGQKIIIP
ncbi:MAG: LysM peptidoglycan-binding domain-containing protein [Clostridia bacterium]|jgi:LysM repeat protein/proteasome lid subunit RPN8/RPN11|nr:LysM peptidoglycan-binding domain-containing protein [Clostridia bacterium]